MFGKLDSKNYKRSIFAPDFIMTFDRAHMEQQRRHYSSRGENTPSNYFHLDGLTRFPCSVVVSRILDPPTLFGKLVRATIDVDVWNSPAFRRVLTSHATSSIKIFPMCLLMLLDTSAATRSTYYSYRWAEISDNFRIPVPPSIPVGRQIGRFRSAQPPPPPLAVAGTSATNISIGTQTPILKMTIRLPLPPIPQVDAPVPPSIAAKRPRFTGNDDCTSSALSISTTPSSTTLPTPAPVSTLPPPPATVSTIPPSTVSTLPPPPPPHSPFLKPATATTTTTTSFLSVIDSFSRTNRAAAVVSSNVPSPSSSSTSTSYCSPGRTKFNVEMDKAICIFAGKHASRLAGASIYGLMAKEMPCLRQCKPLGLRRRLLTLQKNNVVKVYVGEETARKIALATARQK